MTSKPRQEFLGPITKLSAIQVDGYWVSDNYGIVDGYGSLLRNIAFISLNDRSISNHPVTGTHRGAFWIRDTSPTTPYFTDSNGVDHELGTGEMPAGSANTILWNNGVSNTFTNIPVIGNSGEHPSILFGSLSIPTGGTNNTYGTSIGIEDVDSSLVSVGQDLYIMAQNVTGPGFAGLKAGSLWLESGHVSGTGLDGDINLVGGAIYIAHGISDQNMQFLNDSTNGTRSVVKGRLELSTQGSFNTGNNTTAISLQSFDNALVATNEDGYGTYDIVPKCENSTFAPRMHKSYGGFQLTGTEQTKTLTFSTAIHGFQMPPNNVITGTFMIGWVGNGTVTNGGAMKFLFTITSDGYGYIERFNDSISDTGTIPGNIKALTYGPAPSQVDGVGMWLLPSDTHTPLLQVEIDSIPVFTWKFIVTATNNSTSGSVAKFFWEIEYGWGGNT